MFVDWFAGGCCVSGSAWSYSGSFGVSWRCGLAGVNCCEVSFEAGESKLAKAAPAPIRPSASATSQLPHASLLRPIRGTVPVTVASCAGSSARVRLVAIERAVELLELLEQRVLALLERLLAALRPLHRGGYARLPRREVLLLAFLVHARRAYRRPYFTK